MAKTSSDVINQAFRRLGIKAENVALSADEMAYGKSVLDGIFAEISETVDTSAWTVETVPDEYFVALANYLAMEIAPAYSVAPMRMKGGEFLRLMALLRPDNRTDIAEATYY